MHKFEKLEIWQLAIEYADLCYSLAEQLPKHEEHNLASQIRRASVSIALNIAEGSTGQTDPEQGRFLGLSLRSLIETVACLHLIHRRKYVSEPDLIRHIYRASDQLAAKIQAMRRSLRQTRSVHEDQAGYYADMTTPFDES